MNANEIGMREVTIEELGTVEGGSGLLASLVVILGIGQPLPQPQQPTLTHEAAHARS